MNIKIWPLIKGLRIAMFVIVFYHGSLAISQNKCLIFFEKPRSLAKIVNEETLAKIDEIARNEDDEGVPLAHRSKSYLVKSGSNIVKTKLSVVVIHGLLNSPAWMQRIAESAHQMGFNVINLRLPKHFSGDRRQLDRIKAEEFIQFASEIVPIAEGLGERVVYISHSTGGLVSSLAAMRNVEKTAGLVLFSPALMLQPQIILDSYKYGTIGLSGWYHMSGWAENTTGDSTKDNRYMSSYAGIEVYRLGKLVSEITPKEKGTNPGGPHAAVKQLINQVPTLWVDTAIDDVINPNFNVQVATSSAKAQHYLYPTNLSIIHNRTFLSPKESASLAETNARLAVQQMWMSFLKDRAVEQK